MGVVIRATIVLSKFFLIFFINKEEGLEAVGQLGLGFTVLAFVSAVCGLEFYQRQIRRTAKNGLNSYSVAYQVNLILSLFLGFIISFLISLVLLDDNQLRFFIVLCTLIEIILLDYCRFLYTIGSYNKASYLNFLKSIFPLFLLVFFSFYSSASLVKLYFILYALCGIVICIFTIKFNLKLRFKLFNLKYVKSNLKYAKYFILTSLSNNLHEYSDRLLLSVALTQKMFGIYFFAISIVNACRSIIFYGPISQFYPSLIKQAGKVKYPEYKMLILTFLITAVFGVIFFIVNLIPPIAEFLRIPEEITSPNMIAIIFVFTGLLTSLYYFHYLLFSLKMDKSNGIINLVSAAILSICLLYFGSTLSIRELFLLKIIIVMITIASKNYIYRKSLHD